MDADTQALKERIDELEAGMADLLEDLEKGKSPDKLAEAIRALAAQRPAAPAINVLPAPVNFPPAQTTGKWEVLVHPKAANGEQRMTIERIA